MKFFSTCVYIKSYKMQVCKWENASIEQNILTTLCMTVKKCVIRINSICFYPEI